MDSEYYSGVLGIFTQEQLSVLRSKTAAVLGLGRSGGKIALDLAPFVGNLILADPDAYAAKNIAVGQPCDYVTIGQNKAQAVGEQIKRINPDANVDIYPEGLTEANTEQIITRSDIILEGVDITNLAMTQRVHAFARQYQKPVATIVHVGFGVNMFCYGPGSMTWEEHLNISEDTTDIDLTRFVPELPAGMDETVVYEVITGQRDTVPTFLGAVTLGSSLLLMQILNHLLGIRSLVYMPEYIHADLFTLQMAVKKFGG